jgi:interleukin-1 receptor-associated kinase 1
MQVWDKWKAGSIADIADMLLGHRYTRNEMRKCVHIGLLCTSKDTNLRPDASTVMQALDKCPVSLPTPSIPYLADRMVDTQGQCAHFHF